MFTGIVEALGEIAAVQPCDGDLRVRIRSAELDLQGVALGDSIATNGVCLTVVALPGDGYWADVSRETLAHSTFADAKVGQRVNLEKAMLASSRFDGHIVSGHVDGVGRITGRQEDARSLKLCIQAPEELAKYIARKGSVCIDGVSLTVNAVNGAEFELNIVPHTAQQTIICDYAEGDAVNIEIDVIARYVERLVLGEKAAATPGVTKALLAEHGFIKGR